MRIASRAHLIELIPAVETGTLTHAEVNSLFMIVREQAKSDTVVRDIADCIAHDRRHKGLALKHVDDFATELLDAFRFGGMIESRTLYPIEDVLAQLHGIFRDEQIQFDLSTAHSNRSTLTHAIAEVLDGVTFKVKNPLVRRAELSAGEQPAFTFWPVDGIEGTRIPLRSDVGMSGPLFMDMNIPSSNGLLRMRPTHSSAERDTPI